MLAVFPNVVSYIVCSFRMIDITFLPNPLLLQIQEEALHDCIVLTTTLRRMLPTKPFMVSCASSRRWHIANERLSKA